MKSRTKVGLGGLLVVLLGGFLGPLVPAAGAESRLDVSAGYGGFHVPGRSLPVQVTVTAERLVKGELVVLGNGSSPRATLPVEVAGGSVKRFTLIVPGGVPSSAGTVDVELRVGGRALGRGKADVKVADDTELVGLGPQLVEGGSMPGPAALSIDAGVARFAALDAGLLASAPTSLEPLSAVGLAAGELAALAPGVRAALLRWVGGGGRLLLDEAPGTTIDGLPPEWQPGPAGRAAAEAGEVRLTGDAMSAGRWAGLIEPSSVGRDDDNGFFSPESVADSLARDAGLRLPGLPWLLGFLGVYIAVVGPVTGFVLRWRRRPDLAWVVVPGLAVAFTVLAYGAGNQLRPGAGLAHGTILETRASGPVATSWVALTRRSAGTAHVALPAGWAIKGSVANNGNGFGPATPLLTVGDSGPEARLPLASGEFGVFKASGPVSVTGRLEVTASSVADGRAEGTVRNGLPFALDEVAVMVDGRRTRVGSLAPGEQKQWSAVGARVFDPSGSEVWMSEMGSLRSDALVNLSLWQSAQDDLGQDGDQTGAALAVGWTRDWKPEFTVDGNNRRAPGRTAVVGRAPVTVAGGRVTDVAVGADVVRGPSLNPFRGKWIGNNAGEPTLVKMTLPPGPAGRHLMVRTSLPLSDVAVWRNGAWHHLGGAIAGNDLKAILRFKRGIAVNGGVAINGGGFVIDAAPVPTTTTAPPMPGQVPMTTMPVPFPMPPGVPPPMAVPDRMAPVPGGVVGAGAPVDIPLPDGIGADGVLFLRLVADASMGIGGDAVLSLVEVVK